MQVVKECFERVRIIKGVNYGIVTNEQIELLLERYQLTEEQQRHFFALLREHGIKPINLYLMFSIFWQKNNFFVKGSG